VRKKLTHADATTVIIYKNTQIYKHSKMPGVYDLALPSCIKDIISATPSEIKVGDCLVKVNYDESPCKNQESERFHIHLYTVLKKYEDGRITVIHNRYSATSYGVRETYDPHLAPFLEKTDRYTLKFVKPNDFSKGNYYTHPKGHFTLHSWVSM
jgi:hypothetical protein